MSAIFKREMKAYFTSPLGYIILAVFTVISSVVFVINNAGFNPFSGATAQYVQSNDLTMLYSTLLSVLIIAVPLLTMKLLSEEKKLGTDQLLITSPVGVLDIVLGKYFSAAAMYGMSLSVTLIFWVISATNSPSFDFGVAAGNFVAVLLVGMVFIAIGLFISSLTESQLISALGTFVVMLLAMLMPTFASKISSAFVAKAVSALSVYDRYYNFTVGLFDLPAVVFFVSLISAFVFLTARVIEKRRYS